MLQYFVPFQRYDRDRDIYVPGWTVVTPTRAICTAKDLIALQADLSEQLDGDEVVITGLPQRMGV